MLLLIVNLNEIVLNLRKFESSAFGRIGLIIFVNVFIIQHAILD